MTTVIGVLLLVALFILFPLIKRERNRGGCATGRCWKKRVGFGCGGCPLESAAAGKPRADADERPGD